MPGFPALNHRDLLEPVRGIRFQEGNGFPRDSFFRGLKKLRHVAGVTRWENEQVYVFRHDDVGPQLDVEAFARHPEGVAKPFAGSVL